MFIVLNKLQIIPSLHCNFLSCTASAYCFWLYNFVINTSSVKHIILLYQKITGNFNKLQQFFIFFYTFFVYFFLFKIYSLFFFFFLFQPPSFFFVITFVHFRLFFIFLTHEFFRILLIIHLFCRPYSHTYLDKHLLAKFKWSYISLLNF